MKPFCIYIRHIYRCVFWCDNNSGFHVWQTTTTAAATTKYLQMCECTVLHGSVCHPPRHFLPQFIGSLDVFYSGSHRRVPASGDVLMNSSISKSNIHGQGRKGVFISTPSWNNCQSHFEVKWDLVSFLCVCFTKMWKKWLWRWLWEGVDIKK